MRTSLAFAAAMSFALSMNHAAHAQAISPPVPPQPVPARPLPTAIARIADAIAKALATASVHAVVVSAPLASDSPAPRGAELAANVAALVSGKRGGASHARREVLGLAQAREAARGETALVYLRPEIAAGKLRVTADVYPVPRSVWARLRNPEPGPVVHAFAEAPIDAEVRAFLAPVPLVSGRLDRVERAKNFESDVVALACGDVDRDGAIEVVAVSRRRVSTLRLRGGKVQILASRAWTDLAPVAPAPLREPIGFASITEREGGATIDVTLTDRAHALRLDGELRSQGELAGLAVPDGEGSACTRTPSLPGLVVTGALGVCQAGDPAPLAPSIGGQFDAFASARVVSTTGDAYHVWAGRDHGALDLRDDRGHKTAIDSVGAQLALGDLDQDGDPELLASLDTASPLDDAVVVRSWARDAPIPLGAGSAVRLREVLRIPAPAGVRALAVCPPDGPGPAPFVVATADELWVVR